MELRLKTNQKPVGNWCIW